MLGKKVISINKENKEILLDDNQKLKYDSLILATGSHSFVPPINGINNVKFSALKTLEDAEFIKKQVDELKSKKSDAKVVIIGAGFIGAETAHTIKKKGLNVSLLEVAPYILPTVLDEDFSGIVKKELIEEEVSVHCAVKISEVKENVVLTDQGEFSYDLLILVTGVRANVELANQLNIKTNRGIIVDRFMETSEKGVYSCGDCIELNNLVLNTTLPSQLATTALRTGFVAGHNAVSEERVELPGVLNTGSSRIGSLIIASTGINEYFAKKNNIKYVKAVINTMTKEEYAPEKAPLHIKLLCDYSDHIIGSQIIGGEDVVPRIDLIAMAIREKINIREFLLMEHAYSPLTSPVREPISIAAETCVKKLKAIKEWK